MIALVRMRRTVIALVLGASAVLVIAEPASATCVGEPFDRAIRQADAVWWGTVTDATVRGPEHASGNNWTLTIRISHVLKGREQPGDLGTYFAGSCGPPMTRQQGERAASALIGRQELFTGRYADGGVGRLADFFTPQGMSSSEQYTRALADLGLTASPWSTRPGATGTIAWWVPVALVVVLALVPFLLTGRCARRGS